MAEGVLLITVGDGRRVRCREVANPPARRVEERRGRLLERFRCAVRLLRQDALRTFRWKVVDQCPRGATLMAGSERGRRRRAPPPSFLAPGRHGGSAPTWAGRLPRLGRPRQPSQQHGSGRWRLSRPPHSADSAWARLPAGDLSPGGQPPPRGLSRGGPPDLRAQLSPGGDAPLPQRHRRPEWRYRKAVCYPLLTTPWASSQVARGTSQGVHSFLPCGLLAVLLPGAKRPREGEYAGACGRGRPKGAS
jgi:hypothetical protein